MTTDDKARQVGTLMLELKDAESEASHYRERVTGVQNTLQRAGKGRLSTGLKHNNESCLAVSDGSASPEPISLPTPDEVFTAVERLEELTLKARTLKERLQNLGFPQEKPSRTGE